jgi:phosphohistidine phosphatase
MAGRYAQRWQPDLLLSSPANRALTTCRIFARALNYPAEKICLNESIYEASLQELLDVVGSVEDRYHHVALFGHNPGVTSLCNALGSSAVDNMPTCSIAVITFPCERWSEVVKEGEIHCTGELRDFDYPKKHMR